MKASQHPPLTPPIKGGGYGLAISRDPARLEFSLCVVQRCLGKHIFIGDRLRLHWPSIALGMQLAVKAEITNSTNKRTNGTNLPSMKDSNRRESILNLEFVPVAKQDQRPFVSFVIKDVPECESRCR